MRYRLQKSMLLTALLLAALCLLAACAAPEAAPAPVTTPAPTPTGTPQQVDILPLASATPVPATPTPTPSPTPDPYTDGMEKTVFAEGFYHVAINAALKERITGMSFPENADDCPVTVDELRYLRILHVDFAGQEHVGELIVHASLADEVLEIFSALYDARYALTSVRLVDDFGEPGDDTRSMAADNTSSFCCRRVTGSKNYSLHSYGAAIDINPMRNPYIRKDGSVSPANGEAYADRSKDFAGKIDKDDLCYRLFTERGWSWGGEFKTEKDYQHFSKKVED